MKVYKTRHLTTQHLKQVTNLHLNYLNESFINNFGSRFLEISYQTISQSNNNIMLVLLDKQKVVGFAVATKDGGKFNKEVIIKNFIPLTFEVIISGFSKPFLIYRLIEWYFITPVQKKIAPELQFIVIDPKYQGQGWGKKMVLQIMDEFKKMGIQRFRVGTKAENKASNAFYKKLGFKLYYKDRFFGDDFNYYLSPKLL